MEIYFYIVSRHFDNHTIHNYKRGYTLAHSEEEAKDKVLRTVYAHAPMRDESNYTVDVTRTDVIEV